MNQKLFDAVSFLRRNGIFIRVVPLKRKEKGLFFIEAPSLGTRVKGWPAEDVQRLVIEPLLPVAKANRQAANAVREATRHIR